MSANKRVAVANARSKAIQESMLEREINDPLEVPNMDIADCQERTIAWVHSTTPKADDMLHSRVPHSPMDEHTNERPCTPEDGHTRKSSYSPEDRHTSRVHTSLERDVPLLKDTLLVDGISQS